ncbi:MAG: hypothetical protein JRH20_30870 [Deltaproteobacteria bacterium]|nr:hypothetical protein [Deltaproteobacteria bacterium]
MNKSSTRFNTFTGFLVTLALMAELPTGYLVWVKGRLDDPTDRKVYRMTLPNKGDIKALTSGEDVSCQISPDGKWVAYAKAKLPGGTDYHAFNLWKVAIVSIHGVGEGREEIEIDASGYWPSWASANVLYYNQADAKHAKIMRVEIDDDGVVQKREEVFSTRTAFGGIAEINECFMSPDGSWFAARTRGDDSITGVGAYQIDPPEHSMLARAGSIGCMPYVAPSGSWGLIAGADEGIRWGDAPQVPERKVDQLLIAPRAGMKAYHPGVSTDENWVLAAHGPVQNHNSGPYDVYVYKLDAATKAVSDEQALAEGDFNGWPHIWVGEPGPPPAPKPRILSFLPESFTLVAGESTTLRWETRQADGATLDGASVGVNGQQEVTPDATTTYRLEASNSQVADGASAEVTLTVNTSAQPVSIVSFSVDPQTIEQGQSATLSWVVENATTLEVEGTRVAPQGTLQVSPLEATNYTLNAAGHGGPATAEITLAVTKVKDTNLLPDKGGFRCSLGADTTTPDGSALLLLLGVLLFVLRRRTQA